MKCFKLIRYDLKNGLLRNGLLLLTPLCVCIICNQCRLHLSMWEQPGTWAIYLAYCFKGVQSVSVQTLSEAFQMPVPWLLVMVLPLAITLNFPFRDMKTIGPQMLVRSGRRITWWFSKLLWNLCCTVLYFALIFATAAIFCLCIGAELSLETPMGSMMALFYETDITTAAGEMTAGEVAFSLMFMPFWTVTAMDMLEMFLSLMFRPVYSFLLSVALVAASTYATSPLLKGNYANLSRCGSFIHDGLGGRTGFWICFAVIAFSATIGAVVFRRRDVLPDYKEL